MLSLNLRLAKPCLSHPLLAGRAMKGRRVRKGILAQLDQLAQPGRQALLALQVLPGRQGQIAQFPALQVLQALLAPRVLQALLALQVLLGLLVGVTCWPRSMTRPQSTPAHSRGPIIQGRN